MEITKLSALNLNELKKYKNILVSGPQRSGTTICAHMLGDLLNFKVIDEDDININSMHKLVKILTAEDDSHNVIQCPAVSSFLHWIDIPGTLLVMMVRPVREILNSKIRTEKQKTTKERVPKNLCPTQIYGLYSSYFTNAEILKLQNLTLTQVIYFTWNRYQKSKMKIPFIELSYASLSSHRFWVPPEKRVNFKVKQIKP